MSNNKLQVAEETKERIVRLHVHQATNVFGMLETNIGANDLVFSRDPDGIMITSKNPKNAGKAQLLPWANIKTVLIES